MMSQTRRPDLWDAALEQAAEWYTLLRSDEAMDHDRQRGSNELAKHDAHRDARSPVERASLRFQPLAAGPRRHEAADAYLPAHASLARRLIIVCLALLSSAGVSREHQTCFTQDAPPDREPADIAREASSQGVLITENAPLETSTTNCDGIAQATCRAIRLTRRMSLSG
ncbi:hypothetical protein [Pararobbsia silviterrae]|uniref:Uncharacterized protein n=1 Tax=Pararobbsia silviterrae TaxID=1792498 RepID=A0A494XSJ9_9BURK|nr:hypothetical protein [Pararobbsia silviterrae]RKP51846.1 hypothetical protein D7S86_18010 [Pararobbsia silviterrae]